MDIKKSLYTYMTNTPGSFVGFFKLVSEVLCDLGEDWLKHSKDNNDDLAKEWGNILLHTSIMTKNVSDALSKIRDEHDKRSAESQLESFKDKVAEIKSGAQ